MWHLLGISLFFLGIILILIGFAQNQNSTEYFLFLVIGAKIIIITIIFRSSLKLGKKF